MKAMFTAMFLTAMVCLIAAPASSYAQSSDTVWVAASPAGNINNVINGDTLSNGQRAHPNAIYALYRDSLYFFTATIVTNGNLKIVAPSGSGTPPVIAPGILADGSSPGGFISSDAGNLTLKNLYILGVPANNHWLGWGEAIGINGDSSRVVIDSCVFDQWSNGAVDQYGSWDSFWFTNDYFVNDIHSSSYFGGHAWLSHGVPTDTVVMVNNTMFNDNSYAYVPTGFVKISRFEHNTVALNMVNPMNDFTETDNVVSNNIFYSTLMIGQEIDEYYGGWYDTIPYKSFEWSGSSTISYDSLFGLENQYFVQEAGRTVKVDNNAYCWPAKIVNFWTAYNDTVTKMVAVSYPDSNFNLSHGPNDTTIVHDTVKAILVRPIWMNGRTQGMFANKTKYPGFSMANNDSVNPGFPSFVSDQIDSAIQYVLGIRTGTSNGYMWDYTDGQPMFSWLWPLPDLSYSNTTLQKAGTDGYALGDLNFYPSQLAQWKAAGGVGVLGVKQQSHAVPTSFSLSQNYPNPFNPATEIKVSLKKAGMMSLKVYNVLGQLVKVVEQGYKPAGAYTYNVDMSSFASGVYFYTLREGTNAITKKMLLLK